MSSPRNIRSWLNPAVAVGRNFIRLPLPMDDTPMRQLLLDLRGNIELLIGCESMFDWGSLGPPRRMWPFSAETIIPYVPK
jgi:hypothetical protein